MSEPEALLRVLQDQRDHVVQTLQGLPEADLRRSVLPSGWTPLGLVRHLTLDVERFWFRWVVAGEDIELPSDAQVWHVGTDVTVHQVVETYRDQARRSDEVVRARALGSAPARWPADLFADPPEWDLRRTVLHVITETAAHAGQLDVVRELLDGHQHLVMTDFGDAGQGA